MGIPIYINVTEMLIFIPKRHHGRLFYELYSTLEIFVAVNSNRDMAGMFILCIKPLNLNILLINQEIWR